MIFRKQQFYFYCPIAILFEIMIWAVVFQFNGIGFPIKYKCGKNSESDHFLIHLAKRSE